MNEIPQYKYNNYFVNINSLIVGQFSPWQQSPLFVITILVICVRYLSVTLHQLSCWYSAVCVQELYAHIESVFPSTA